MNKQDRDFITPLMEENTTTSWTEAICIALAQLKDKDGKALQIFTVAIKWELEWQELKRLQLSLESRSQQYRVLCAVSTMSILRRVRRLLMLPNHLAIPSNLIQTRQLSTEQIA